MAGSSEKNETLIQKDICVFYIHCSIIYNKQAIEVTYVFISRQMVKKVDMCVHTHSGILLSHEKEWNLAITATWTDLEGIMRSEITHRKMDTMSFHLYVKSKN